MSEIEQPLFVPQPTVQPVTQVTQAQQEVVTAPATEQVVTEPQTIQEAAPVFDAASVLAEANAALTTKVVQAPVAEVPQLSPIAKAVADMEAAGKSQADIATALQKMSRNVDAMADIDVVRESISEKYPTLSQEDVDALIAKNLGVEDLADLPKNAALQLKVSASEARQGMKQVTPTEAPKQTDIAQPVNQAEIEAKQRAYGIVATSLGKSMNSLVVGANASQGYDGLSYTVPQETLRMAENIAANWAMEQGLDLSESNIPAIRSVMEQAIFAANHKDILNAVASDAFAKARLKTVAEVSNPNPIKVHGANAPIVPRQSGPPKGDGQYF